MPEFVSAHKFMEVTSVVLSINEALVSLLFKHILFYAQIMHAVGLPVFGW
jgi:hypothetical protein